MRRVIGIQRNSQLVLGIGDDCAIYRPRGSAEDLLFTTDLFIEGTHFERQTHKPHDAGRKALARSLSDIAAMGGAPRFCLVSLSVAAWTRSSWISGFFDGLLELATATGTVLVGGDLAHGDQLACDVAVCGAVPRGTALRRDGARIGDEIFVSGRLGGSALGLATRRGRAWKRYLRPEPRLELGRFLRRWLHATAAMDLSDGLSLDLRRLCLESEAAAEISDPPRFPGASAEFALNGGEDYELLFTVRPDTKVPPQFENVPLSRIGTIIKGPAGKVLLGGKALRAGGYDHFRRRSSLNQQK